MGFDLFNQSLIFLTFSLLSVFYTAANTNTGFLASFPVGFILRGGGGEYLTGFSLSLEISLPVLLFLPQHCLNSSIFLQGFEEGLIRPEGRKELNRPQ